MSNSETYKISEKLSEKSAAANAGYSVQASKAGPTYQSTGVTDKLRSVYGKAEKVAKGVKPVEKTTTAANLWLSAGGGLAAGLGLGAALGLAAYVASGGCTDIDLVTDNLDVVYGRAAEHVIEVMNPGVDVDIDALSGMDNATQNQFSESLEEFLDIASKDEAAGQEIWSQIDARFDNDAALNDALDVLAGEGAKAENALETAVPVGVGTAAVTGFYAPAIISKRLARGVNGVGLGYSELRKK